ncbi:MAG: hypothetical protein FWC22_03960, partial [Treponema sp.]|nr:hypothetical protein [Treponema sp.]
MNKPNKHFTLVFLSVLIFVVLSGCASLITRVSISSYGNLSSVLLGGSISFRASGREIVWTVSSRSDGTGAVADGTFITSNGVLTVAYNETALIIYVIATSARDDVSAVRQVRVVTVSGVNITPANQVIPLGRSAQFRAQVLGNNQPDHAVTWRVSSNASGTGSVMSGTSINSDGTLSVSANETFRTLYVIATSVVDPRVSNLVSVTVVVPTVTSVSVGPVNQSVRAGSVIQFSASVTGMYDPVSTVTWNVSSNAAGTGVVTPGTSIRPNGLLTVSNNESLSVLYVIATSTYDPSKSGSVVVSVIRPIVNSVIVSPSNQAISAGSIIQFNAQVFGTNDPSTEVTWRVSSNAAGTGTITAGTGISANGLLTVSPNETATMLYIFATSVFDPTKSGSVIITVTPAVTVPVTPTLPVVTSVSVSPPSRTMNTNESLQFTAVVTGTNNPGTAVTWRVSSNAAGTGAVTAGTSVNANGFLTVSANETRTTLYVIATSTADTTKSGIATVTVNMPPAVTGITVSPATHTMGTGETRQFTAAVTGTNNPGTAVTWRVSSNAVGTGAVTAGTSISANGLLTVSASETRTTLYVIATSTADTTKTGSATVTVNIPATVTSVTVSPSSRTMERGGTHQFSATVTGTNSPSTAVTWRVSSNAAGTGSVTSGTSINTSGLLTVAASETNTTLYVIATSSADT